MGKVGTPRADPTELIGQKFGSVVVEEFAGVWEKDGKPKGSIWKCRCEFCGSIRNIKRTSLFSKLKTPTSYCSVECRHAQQAKSRIGEKLGRLTVIGRDEARKEKEGLLQTPMLWRCDCGAEFSEHYHVIKEGIGRTAELDSCSLVCHNLNEARQHVGQKFGRLKILDVAVVKGRTGFVAMCDCGEIVDKAAKDVKAGMIASCGCLQMEWGSQLNERFPQERPPRTTTLEQDVYDRVGPEAKTWKKTIKLMFDRTCQKCGDKRYGDLVCHHILNFLTSPELRHDLGNGILFCEPRHWAFHGKYGRYYNTREQVEEFIGG